MPSNFYSGRMAAVMTAIAFTIISACFAYAAAVIK